MGNAYFQLPRVKGFARLGSIRFAGEKRGKFIQTCYNPKSAYVSFETA